MARYVARVRTERTPESAFAYMADLTNFAQWDPGVERAEAVEGSDESPPRAVDVTVKGFVGDLTLRYRVTELDPPRSVVARAETRFLTSLDRITVEATDEGSLVTYDAELTLNGLLGPVSSLLQPTFDRIGAKAARGMASALDGTLVEA